MSNTLSDLSNELTSAVERAAASVVAVHGRPRIPSSGVIWRPGLVLTADAALRRDEDLRITLPDGATAAAKLKGRDPATDLALLAYDSDTPARTDFISATLKPGQIILTVGRTTNTGPIATMGIVSGTAGEWPTWRGGKLDQFVRLDVSIYPTSEGGAVVDIHGNIVGIVAAGLSRSSVIGITRSTIDRVAEPLSTRGHIPRGYLGIGLQPVQIPSTLKQQLSIQQDTGVMALTVQDAGPAATAGMLIGDVLLSLGGQTITGPEALHAALDSPSVGKQWALRILRGGVVQHLSVTIAERPREAETNS